MRTDAEARTAAAEWDVWSTRARVVVTDPRRLDESVARVQALLAEVDEAASRFRVDSELSTLAERRGPDGTVRLSPLLADLVRVALRAARASDGAVDPTVGAALLGLGYDRDLAEVQARGAGTPVTGVTGVTSAGRLPIVLRPVPGWRTLRLDGDRLHLPDGVVLDLGATAKARATDLAVARLQRADPGSLGVLVSLGGDLATAGPAPDGGWQVAVDDETTGAPTEDDTAPGSRVRLASGWALATSSTARRTWTHAGRHVHHIVDPGTGAPAAAYWRSVTVCATTCTAANTASTAAIVLGQAATSWLRSRGYQARLVTPVGRVRRLGGWPLGIGSPGAPGERVA